MSRKVSAAALIALVAVLIIGVTASVLYFISAFRLVDSPTNLSPEGSFSSPGDESSRPVFGAQVSAALDQLAISAFISEYQLRNGGSYPSVQYLTGLESSNFPLFYKKIDIKDKSDNPSVTALPQFREIHIWPGYGCASKPGSLLAPVDTFEPGEINYDEFIVEHDDMSEYSLVNLKAEWVWPDYFLGRFPQGQIEMKWVLFCADSRPQTEIEDDQ